jgi:hypothetical protein
MNYACLKDLLLALTLLGAVFTLPGAASGLAGSAQTPPDTGAQAVANSIMIRTGIGATMEMSSPLEVSCERMPALGKVAQGKPAEVTNATGEPRRADGSAESAGPPSGTADHADASQLSIPSHGRTLTLKIAGGNVTIACDDASSPGNVPPAQ